MPILYFGDVERFAASPLRVMTVGINPSSAEFPKQDPFARFPEARRLDPSSLKENAYRSYFKSLGNYFRTNPYGSWFATFEHLLKGMETSYYDGTRSTTIHTDLCSPLSTDPTWSRLDKKHRGALALEGSDLWHELVRLLVPEVILASVARVYLESIRFPKVGLWRILYTVERQRPYEVRVIEIEVSPGKTTFLVYGQAAQKPFGTVSNAEKQTIGSAILERLHGG